MPISKEMPEDNDLSSAQIQQKDREKLAALQKRDTKLQSSLQLIENSVSTDEELHHLSIKRREEYLQRLLDEARKPDDNVAKEMRISIITSMMESEEQYQTLFKEREMYRDKLKELGKGNVEEEREFSRLILSVFRAQEECFKIIEKQRIYREELIKTQEQSRENIENIKECDSYIKEFRQLVELLLGKPFKPEKIHLKRTEMIKCVAKIHYRGKNSLKQSSSIAGHSSTEAPVQPTNTEAPVQPTNTEAPVQPTNTEAPLQPTNKSINKLMYIGKYLVCGVLIVLGIFLMGKYIANLMKDNPKDSLALVGDIATPQRIGRFIPKCINAKDL